MQIKALPFLSIAFLGFLFRAQFRTQTVQSSAPTPVAVQGQAGLPITL